jgi:ribosomal protein S6E (S10)
VTRATNNSIRHSGESRNPSSYQDCPGYRRGGDGYKRRIVIRGAAV